MLPQEDIVEKVRELSERDKRVVSALMYGSFALGQGDRFSDIEFYLFFADEAWEGLQEEAWVGQFAPLELYYVNEFSNGTAIFENLSGGSSTSRSPRTYGWSTRGRPLGSLHSSPLCW